MSSSEGIQPSDSFTGYCIDQMTDWRNESDWGFGSFCKRVAAEVGYGLFTLVGLVETAVSGFFGTLAALFSCILPEKASEPFYEEVAAPLLNRAATTGCSTVLSFTSLFQNIFSDEIDLQANFETIFPCLAKS